MKPNISQKAVKSSSMPNATKAIAAISTIPLGERQIVTFKPGRFGMTYSAGIVTHIGPDSQAEKSGVQIGWKIVEVNGMKYSQPEIMNAISKTQKLGKSTVILFQTEDLEITEVRKWLQSINMEKYAEQFMAENYMNLAVIGEMNEDDIIEMIEDVGIKGPDQLV